MNGQWTPYMQRIEKGHAEKENGDLSDATQMAMVYRTASEDMPQAVGSLR